MVRLLLADLGGRKHIASVPQVVKPTADADLAQHKVCVLPAKAQEFRAPHTGVKGGVKEGVVGRASGDLQESGYLLFAPGVNLRPLRPGRVDSVGHVTAHQPPLKRRL